MGLFSKKKKEEIRASPEEQSLEVDGVLEEFFRGVLDQERIYSDEEAMGIPALAGCMEFICGIAAAVPIRLYELGENEEKEVTDDHRLKLLNQDTGDLLSGPEWKKAFFRDYLLRGRAWAYLNRNLNSLVSLHYVDDRSVSVTTNEDPIFKDAVVNIHGRQYYPFQFIHMARNTKDGVRGQGLLKQARKQLSMALNYMDFENAIVRGGGNKRGFLQSDHKLSEDYLDKLQEGFQKMYGANYEGVVVLNKGVTFTPAQATSVEMQLAENKARNREDICSLLCLPVSIITGNAKVEEFSQAIQVAVMPLLDGFNEALNRAALLEAEKGRLHFACDTRDLQSGDLLKRYNAYTAACKAGWLSKNEIRYKEKYKPIEGLDVVSMSLGDIVFDVKSRQFYVPNTGTTVNMTAVGSGQQPPGLPAPSTMGKGGTADES